MSSVFRLSGSLGLGPLASAPANPQPGEMYYDTSLGKVRKWDGSDWQEVIDEAILSTQLDDVIGALDATPDNYTPADTTVAGHLSGIDEALLATGKDEFSDAEFRVFSNADDTKQIAFSATAITTATTRTISMPDADVDLAEIAALRTLSGTAATSTHLGSFTGSTIPDDQTIKAALQALETSLETKADDADVIKKDGSVDYTGDQSMGGNKITNLGAPTVDGDAATKKYVDDEIQEKVTDELGVANGIATLDSNGKVPITQLPNSIMEYKGTWNADTNTPELLNGAGNNDPEDVGDVYRVTTAGTTDFGAGNISFEIGDYAILNDDFIWEKAQTSEVVAGVSSVNGEVGDVVLDSSDLDHTQGNTGDWTVADESSVAAHLDELASRTTNVEDTALTAVEDDTTPKLGGDLEVDGNAIEGATSPVLLAGQDSVRRAKQASKSDWIEEEYIHATTLTADTTDAEIAALTVTASEFDGMEITYRAKQETSGLVRIGTMRITHDGSDGYLSDVATESGDLELTFNAVIDTGDLKITYTNAHATNNSIIRMDVKRFKV